MKCKALVVTNRSSSTHVFVCGPPSVEVALVRHDTCAVVGDAHERGTPTPTLRQQPLHQLRCAQAIFCGAVSELVGAKAPRVHVPAGRDGHVMVATSGHLHDIDDLAVHVLMILAEIFGIDFTGFTAGRISAAVAAIAAIAEGAGATGVEVHARGMEVPVAPLVHFIHAVLPAPEAITVSLGLVWAAEQQCGIHRCRELQEGELTAAKAAPPVAASWRRACWGLRVDDAGQGIDTLRCCHTHTNATRQRSDFRAFQSQLPTLIRPPRPHLSENATSTAWK